MLQPDIYLFGIRIQEPMTVFTDILVTIFCIYAIRVLHKNELKGQAVNFLKLFFIALGISTFLGGVIGHGFQYIFGLQGKLWGWIPFFFAVYFFECSAVAYLSTDIPKKQLRRMNGLNLFIMISFILLTIYTMQFKYALIHTFYGIIIVGAQIHWKYLRKYNSESSRNILFGIVVLISTMIVFAVPINLHVWFNFNDLSHILVIFACWYFLRAGLKMETPLIEKQIVNEN